MSIDEFKEYTKDDRSNEVKKAAIDKMLRKFSHELSGGDWDIVLTVAKKVKHREDDVNSKLAARINENPVKRHILGWIDPKYA